MVEPGDLFKRINKPEIWCIIERYYFPYQPPDKQDRRWLMCSLQDHSRLAWLEEDRLLNGSTWERVD